MAIKWVRREAVGIQMYYFYCLGTSQYSADDYARVEQKSAEVEPEILNLVATGL